MRRTLLIATTLLLSSCASQDPQALMSATRYEETIPIHSDKKAYIAWESGTESRAALETQSSSSIIGDIIINVDKSRNPAKYEYGYSKANKVVFITSLRDVLALNNVFSNIEIITSSHQPTENEVLITINFKRTSVSSHQGHLITLNAEIDIEDSTGHFTKTHLVKTTPDEGFSDSSYAEKQEEVSAQLMKKIIRDIEKWHKQT